MIIRDAITDDIAQVMHIDHLVLKTNWSDRLYTESLFLKDTYFKVLTLESKVIGFHLYRNIGGDFEILQIAMHPHYQNKGLGSMLLEFMIQQAQADHIENIYLEVHFNNKTAIKMYEAYSFERIHERKNYYGPNETGIVMKKEC